MMHLSLPIPSTEKASSNLKFPSKGMINQYENIKALAWGIILILLGPIEIINYTLAIWRN